MSRTPRAFTLVELVMALTIMAILAGIAVPRYSASVNNYRADFAARRLAADLALAQSSARAASSPRIFRIGGVAGGYTISGLAAMDGNAGEYAVNLAAEPYVARISGVTMTDNTDDNEIVFDGYGVPDSGATISVSSGSAVRTVTLSAATGAVSVQ